MLRYGMRTLAICLSFFLGLSYAASSSSPHAESGQLVVDVVDFKFANNYYELVSADENTFVVIERIDVIHNHSPNLTDGLYSAHDKHALLQFFVKANNKRRYENVLSHSDIVSNGSLGLTILPGYTLEALNPTGADRAIISYRIFSQ